MVRKTTARSGVKKKKYKSPLKRRWEKCDELFGENKDSYIKTRDNHACQNPLCKHETTILQWSHFIPRGRTSTRWDEDNGWTLCRNCHYHFDNSTIGRLSFDALVLSRLGQERYFALKEKARQTVRDREAVELCENFLREKGYSI